MPILYIYHNWVEIPPPQQGSSFLKCHQCGRQIIRTINARGMCDFCMKVLCSHACFVNCHGSDGYRLIPYLTSGRDFLPKILLFRELGGICRIGVTKLTIEYVVLDCRIMQSSSSEPDTDTDHGIIQSSSSSSDTDTETYDI